MITGIYNAEDDKKDKYNVKLIMLGYLTPFFQVKLHFK